MSDTLQVLVVSKGHDYNHDSFLAMFESFEEIEMTLVQHPAAAAVLSAPSVERYQAVFFYDMCGIPGMSLSHDESAGSGKPTAAYAAAVEALLACAACAPSQTTSSWLRRRPSARCYCAESAGPWSYALAWYRLFWSSAVQSFASTW